MSYNNDFAPQNQPQNGRKEAFAAAKATVEIKKMPENEKDTQPDEATVDENKDDNTEKSQIDKDTESVMDDLDNDKGNDKKQTKQLKEENKKLTRENTEIKGKLDKAEKDLNETTDKYMRVCAEYDNFRKRSQKEREGIYADAYSDALKEVLPVIDNLERAAQYNEAEKLAEGLGLILRSTKDMLSKLGVEEFGTAGDKFDPTLHNAVMHVEDDEHGEDEIVDVFQKGYKKGDKIIRHAMVKVAN